MLRKVIKGIEELDRLSYVSGPAAGWVRGPTRHDAVEHDAAETAMPGTWPGHKLDAADRVGSNHIAFELDVTDRTNVALSSLNDGKPVRVTPGGGPVVLVRHDGPVYAQSADRVDVSGPPDLSTLSADRRIRCPWPGSAFRLTYGRVARGAASVDQPSWRVKVDDGRVLVRSSAPAVDA